MSYEQPPWAPQEKRQGEPQQQQQQASAGFGGVSGPPPQQGPPQPLGPSGPQSMPPQGSEQGGGQQAQQAPPMVPPVDIVETPDEIRVYVDAPGYEKDEIHIHADANTLLVSADRSENPLFDPEEDERGLLVERPVRLERSVQLPIHIDPDNAEASFENGVCEIVVSKDESEQRREIGFQ